MENKDRIKPRPVSMSLNAKDLLKLVNKSFIDDLIFLRQFDKMFKTSITMLATSEERFKEISDFALKDDFNKFLFEYFVFSYLKKYFYHEEIGLCEQPKYKSFKRKLERITKNFELDDEE